MKPRQLLPLLIAVFLIAAGGVFSLLSSLWAKTQLSGTITFTALKPDPGDKGSLTVKYKRYQKEEEYRATGLVLPLQNNATFTWESAKKGETYEVIAELEIDGVVVKQSEPVTVSAPATQLELPLRISWRDLPKDVVESQTASVKGEVTLNGYLPAGSTLQITAKGINDLTARNVASYQELQPLISWTWSGAAPLQDYVVQAILKDNRGQVLGTSAPTEVFGGDTAIELVLNSLAKHPSDVGNVPEVSGQVAQATPPPAPTTAPNVSAPPTPQPTAPPAPTPTPRPTVAPQPQRGTISGTVTLNGPSDNNSSLLILWRRPGEKDFQVVTRILDPKQGGQKWSWDQAIVGREYEITVALQVWDNNTATGRVQRVTASATDVNFTLNTGVVVQTPPEQPEILACDRFDDFTYDVSIKWPRKVDAGNYWFQVGTRTGSGDALEQKTPAGDNQTNIITKTRIDKNKYYYAHFAYSLCVKCSSPLNFSNFSQPLQLYCGDKPAN